jgi:hypothetical protein
MVGKGVTMVRTVATLFTSPKVLKMLVAGIAVTVPVAALVAQTTRPSDKPTIQVYKTPTCGCCSKWVDHLKAAGYSVTTTDLDDIEAVKTKYGVPTDLGSCHTAVANGYVIEGHVPVADITRMLKEKPKIAGIAVPSMPAGSPGMEVPGGRVQPYRVIAFEKSGGKTSVYATYGGAERR